MTKAVPGHPGAASVVFGVFEAGMPIAGIAAALGIVAATFRCYAASPVPR